MVLFWIKKVSWESWEREKGKKARRKRETHTRGRAHAWENTHTRVPACTGLRMA